MQGGSERFRWEDGKVEARLRRFAMVGQLRLGDWIARKLRGII